MRSTRRAIAVRLLDAAAGGDAGLAARLSGLINEVYASAEDGLWRQGATRTTPSEVAGLIGARQIAVATVSGRLAGAIRVRALSDVMGEFGMLAADPRYRGIGVGRQLVAFAVRHCSDDGLQAMELELLVPRTFRHPSKELLDGWYRRIGYRVMRTTSVAEVQAGPSPLLATPCDFVIYRKPLAGGRTPWVMPRASPPRTSRRARTPRSGRGPAPT